MTMGGVSQFPQGVPIYPMFYNKTFKKCWLGRARFCPVYFENLLGISLDGFLYKS